MAHLLRTTAADLKRFFKTHWVHIVISPAMAVITFTVAHEAAHAAAVLLQGGKVLEFNCVPGGGRWGHIRYELPAGHAYSDIAIAVAPYVLWAALALLACVLSARRRPYPRWVAGTIFLWLYAAPLADVANAAFPYSFGADNDLHHAFGPPTATSRLVVAAATAAAAVGGFFLQKRLYRADAFGWPAYVLLGAVALGGLCIITGII